MWPRGDSPLRIFTAILVTLSIGGVRSFPALERPDGAALPTEIEIQEEMSIEPQASSPNATEDPAIPRVPVERTIKYAAGEEPLPQPLKLDYYDYLQLPNDPEDELPALPDHAVNVNEDYAGIYDYRGSQDGRFRRKRTLTTNVEQFLTRSSRIRARRGAKGNVFDDNAAAESLAEQAETLVSLLSVMQDSDPEFDATEFLKVLEAPSVSEQDLEYLLLLSNLASQKELSIPRELITLRMAHRPLPSGLASNHQRMAEGEPFRSPEDVALEDISKDEGSLAANPERARLRQRMDFPDKNAMTSVFPPRGQPTGIAM